MSLLRRSLAALSIALSIRAWRICRCRHSKYSPRCSFDLPVGNEQTIHCLLLDSTDAAESVCRRLKESNPELIGIDAEWVSRLSVLQLATAHECFIIRLNCMPTFPPSLRYILEDGNVFKSGVGISGDVRKCEPLCVKCVLSQGFNR